MRHTGRVLTRPMISEHVWNQDFDTFTNVIDVYVNYLRNKIDRPFTQVDHDLLRIVAQIAATVLVRAEAVAGEGPSSKR